MHPQPPPSCQNLCQGTATVCGDANTTQPIRGQQTPRRENLLLGQTQQGLLLNRFHRVPLSQFLLSHPHLHSWLPTEAAASSHHPRRARAAPSPCRNLPSHPSKESPNPAGCAGWATPLSGCMVPAPSPHTPCREGGSPSVHQVPCGQQGTVPSCWGGGCWGERTRNTRQGGWAGAQCWPPGPGTNLVTLNKGNRVLASSLLQCDRALVRDRKGGDS